MDTEIANDLFNPSLRVFINTVATNVSLDFRAIRLTCQQEFSMGLLVSRFLSNESGATAIEYCLIAAGLSIVIVTAVNGIGSTLNGRFTSINTSLK